ncbi:MAG: 4-hydroxy-3-methylbut-2-en-1-yl diphosphate synthase [Chlamydiae bacterium CG10_big_fil_rev_8_21_14_0_10_35_9]|nr:MAG: 4-hydroxy-3-methylbut-2-en-1-yl diphosphate synthase [Chlamydiae bacterium CG10_big_fil_rev_8_21_14_0_10_35_9]
MEDFKAKKRKTREVLVGSVKIGGQNPIRIQSMTTTNTNDIEKTVEQISKLKAHGCEIVRVTVQGKKEALSCEKIKNLLVQKNIDIPLVADIHFYPPAALIVADFVDKIRINPGNFADRRAIFQTVAIQEKFALEKIEEKLAPLILKCKQLKKSIRIGANHGSLSDRIMSAYGDTPEGMVVSAIEYGEIARKYDFHDMIFSMKASNPLVMIKAYRLLVKKMDELGWDYPLHLGVTEAGQGEDGRIKSAVGIGSLLLEGLGDTIRVSLTEDPHLEIDPCKRLVNFSNRQTLIKIPSSEELQNKTPFLHRSGSVIIKLQESDLLNDSLLKSLGLLQKEAKIDAVWVEDIQDEKSLLKLKELAAENIKIIAENSLMADYQIGHDALHVQEVNESAFSLITQMQPKVILLDPLELKVHSARKLHSWLKASSFEIPIILAFSYLESWDDFLIAASSEVGSLLCDNIGAGICLQHKVSIQELHSFSFNLLQACRMRTIKTEFISCPSCGRTLFDLQEVAARIRKKTGHLPGVKIAIMGCIVNGPGEMADADFGYVGSRPGMVDLYVGKKCVEKNISFSDADEKLIALIKSHGLWVDPPSKKEEVALM